MNVLPSQFALLRRSLDFAEQSHRVVGQNIANVNTPGYQAQQVVFDESLARLVERGDDEVLSRVTLSVRPAGGASSRKDGNNVDIDRELGNLNQNALLFRAYTELLQARLAEMRSAMELR